MTTPVYPEKKAESQVFVDLGKVGILFVAVATGLISALFCLFYAFSNESTALIFDAGMKASALVSASFFGGWFFLKRNEPKEQKKALEERILSAFDVVADWIESKQKLLLWILGLLLVLLIFSLEKWQEQCLFD